MQEDFLVIGGGALKSLSDSGKVGGYLVLFNEIDLQQDYFTSATDFWLEGKSLLPLIWRHGLDETLGRKKLTHVYHSIHDQGLWIEGKLPLGSSAEIDQIWDGIQKDEIGLSSGSAGHLVHREFNPRRGAHEIKSWPVTEGSLTPRPVQPRSRAVALKSLTDFDTFAPFRNSDVERRAMQIYANCLNRDLEMKMREFETSQHGDAISQEQAYYKALAEIEMRKLEEMTRRA